MGKSKKKAIIKDNTAPYSKIYNKVYRNTWSQITRSVQYLSNEELESIEYPEDNSIVNQYDICDYILDYEYPSGGFVTRYLIKENGIEELKEKFSRK